MHSRQINLWLEKKQHNGPKTNQENEDEIDKKLRLKEVFRPK